MTAKKRFLDVAAKIIYKYLKWYCKKHLQTGSCTGCIFQADKFYRCPVKAPHVWCRYASETDLYSGIECRIDGSACMCNRLLQKAEEQLG